MKTYAHIIIQIAIVLITVTLGYGQSQTYLSEYWTGQGGEMAIFYQNVTKTDAQRNVYVAGSTLNTSNNNDIILQKFNRDGDLLWEQTFNGAANMDDMAADMFVDNSMNIYVTGTSVASANSSFDLVVLKYNSNGQLQWTQYYDNGGSPDPYDAGTSIIGDNNGSIFVTGGSFGSNTLSDYVTLRLNSSNGNIIWSQRYDYAQLNDLASKIQISGNQVVVSGGSQITLVPNRYELATLTYDKNSGALLSTRRSSGSATSGTDEIYDITVDDSGNFYLTGSVVNSSTGHDLAVYKLDDELNIVWQQTWDGYGNDDKGQGIKLDSQGNVYVAGYTKSTSEGDNFAILKYSNSGSLIWNREYNGEANSNDRARQLVIDANNRIYVTGEARNTSHSDYQTVGYTPNGDIFAQTSFDGPEGLDDKPSAVALDLDGNLIVVGQSQVQGGWKNYTVKYAVYERSLAPVLVSGQPSHVDGELLIRFDRSVVNYDAINNKRFQAGRLNEFVSQNAINQMSQKVGFDCSRLETFKIFRRMTTADTVSVNRLGETIKMDDHWATLSVYFPKEYNQQEVADSLSTLLPTIHYAELDPIAQFHDEPNDPLYIPQQPGLFDGGPGIRAEAAWNNQVGQTHTGVGVYDSGINWRHEDFGDGTWNGTKIEGGWDFYNNASPENQETPDPDGHGTAVAGIVGALRNNSTGSAGVAGGDTQNQNTGCQLFSMGIPTYIPVNDNQVISVVHSIAAPAIVEGAAFNPNTGFGYGLDIQNHSWGAPQFSVTLENAVRSCWENSCLFVVSSGNDGDATINFPASFQDEWVLKVGANNANSVRAPFSTFGNALDIVAPGTNDLYASLDHDNNSGYDYDGDGTSFAAPHVAGVAALLHSEHHVNNGYPNNLAPEDFEEIIQRFPTDILDPGFDQQTGFGIVNAEEALAGLSMPQFQIRHAGGQSDPLNTVAASQNVVLAENINGIAAGIYTADRHQVTYNFITILEPNQTMIDIWPRLSSSIGTSAANPLTGQKFFNFTVTTTQNVVSVSTTTFAWFISSSVWGQAINQWIPAHPSQLQTAYSIYVEDNTITSVREIEKESNVNLFPNPSTDQFTMSFELLSPADVQLELIDGMGRVVANHNLPNQSSGSQSVTIDIANLSSGLYLCNLYLGNERITKRVVKQ
jgi:subtilisin family serine protease